MIHPPDLQDLILKYNNGQSMASLCKETGYSWEALRRLFKINGVSIRGQVKRNVNEDYFKEIDSHEKAYFLGLIWSDGGISKNRKRNDFYGTMTISLVEEDSYILEEMRKSFQLEGELKKVKKEGNRQQQKGIDLCNKKFVENLVNLGLKGDKTNNGGVPKIKDEYMSSFILGFFDGDGSFGAWENPKRMEKNAATQ